MHSILKLWWIGAVISLGASVLGAILMRLFMYIIGSELGNTFLILIAFLSLFLSVFCIIAMVLAFALTAVLVFTRFYKHFFTDEGYLTFTLPVSRKTLLFSKTVNAVLWISLHLVVLIISFIIFGTLVIPPEEGQFLINFKIFHSLSQWFLSNWALAKGWVVIYGVEAILVLFLSIVYSISLIHFCITFGAVVVKKARLLVSIGIYYAVSSVVSFLFQFGGFLISGFMSPGFSFLTETATQNQVYAIYSFLLFIAIAIIGVITFAVYSLTQFLLDRKLNLA